MKTAVVALSCLTGVMISFAAGAAGGGRSATLAPGAQWVGVVRIMDLLQRLSEAGKFTDMVKADQAKAQAELNGLAQEIAAQERELGTLKSATQEYLRQAEVVAEKKARYSAHKEFLERQLVLKQQQWTQKAYGEIMRVTQIVATEKGLSLVLVKDELNLEQAPPESITRLIAGTKVLYSDGCPDITREVQARLLAVQP